MKKAIVLFILLLMSAFSQSPVFSAESKLGNTAEYIIHQSGYILPVAAGLYLTFGLPARAYLSLGFRSDTFRNRILLGGLVAVAGMAMTPFVQNLVVNPVARAVGAVGDLVAKIVK